MTDFRAHDLLLSMITNHLESSDDKSRFPNLTFFQEALQVARLMALSERQSRFGSYLSDYPQHLSTGAFSAIEQAFPRNLVSLPLWIEYDFEHWTTPAFLSPTIPPSQRPASPKLFELAGHASSPTLHYNLDQAREGHLLFQMTDNSRVDNLNEMIGCFSVLYYVKKDKTPSISSTPYISHIDKEFLETMQYEIAGEDNSFNKELFEKAKHDNNFTEDKSVIFAAFKERRRFSDLDDVLPKTENQAAENSLNEIYQNMVSHNSLHALAALSISQCHLPYTAMMPGRLGMNPYMNYLFSRCTMKWISMPQINERKTK